MELDGASIKPRGRLIAAERQRKRDLNLCFYCESDKHAIENCPKLAGKPRKINASAATISNYQVQLPIQESLTASGNA